MTSSLALSISSGLALVFAFPPESKWFVAWAALVPLFLVLEKRGWKGGFAAGFAAGFAFFLGAVYWVVHSMHNYGGLPVPVSVVVMLALVAYMALFWGAFGALYSLARGLSWSAKVLLVPSFWVALEFVRTHLFTGFPWVLIGYTQSPFPPLIQAADLAGVWVVSFAVVAFNAALTSIACGFFSRGKGGRVPVFPAAFAAALVLSMTAYGLLRMKAVDLEAAGWKTIKVAVAQGSIDQGVKWDGRYQKETVDIYGKLTAESAKNGARLVVWPETAMPFHYDPDEVRGGVVGELARETSTYILTGSPSYTYNPESRAVSYFNSAFVIDPSGETAGRYDKFHLVPFGEYLPLRGLLPFEKLTAGIGDFTAGKGPHPIDFGEASAGVLICFESIFPGIAREQVGNGANLLVTITNDAWFGRTSAPYQHFQMSVFRAVENRSYLVRSANTGISGFIDPVGRVRKTTGLFERVAIADEVGLRRGQRTFYGVYGDFFAWCASAVTVAFLASRKRRP